MNKINKISFRRKKTDKFNWYYKPSLPYMSHEQRYKYIKNRGLFKNIKKR